MTRLIHNITDAPRQRISLLDELVRPRLQLFDPLVNLGLFHEEL
jgi:hypothetical protein